MKSTGNAMLVGSQRLTVKHLSNVYGRLSSAKYANMRHAMGVVNMKKYLIYRKEIEVSDKNKLHCDVKCPQIFANKTSSKCCLLNWEKLAPIADGKPFPETFLRTGNCLEREENENKKL